MQFIRALKMRIYPDAEQTLKIDKTIGSCRYVYNHMLARNKKVYKRRDEHIANQRRDYHQKLSTELANKYDAILIEDLDAKAMANKGLGNGKATLDNGWGHVYHNACIQTCRTW